MFNKISKILVLTVLVLSACNPERYCANHGYGSTVGDTTIRHDSVVYHDSIVEITIPPDNSSAQFLIDCQDRNAKLLQLLAYKPGEHTTPPRVEIRDNILYVNCDVNEWKAFVKVRSSELYKDVYRAKVVVKITNVLTGWQQFWIRCGQIAGGIIILYIGVKYGWPFIRKALIKI